MANEELKKTLDTKYNLGFSVDLNSDTIPKGLSEDVIRIISLKKEEPEWLLEWRLTAYRHWLTLTQPIWGNLKINPIDYQDLHYYSSPKNDDTGEKKEIPQDLIDYYDKLGVPLKEREILAGNIAVDAVLDSVSVGTTFRAKLEKSGVIFCSFSDAVKQYPELVKEYLGSVVSYKDNYFASLNSAVFSDGSFAYIPKGVKCPMELSTYFRINQAKTGQFERTLIVAEEGSYVSYLEGCFLENTPIWTPEGNKYIQHINIKDLVYDHNGHAQKVKSLMTRVYEGDVFSIKYIGSHTPIKSTKEHPFLVAKRELLINNKSIIDFSIVSNINGEWIESKDLKIGDFIFRPFLTNDIDSSYSKNNLVIKSDKGYWIPITSITKETMKANVYNFEVENTNTYLAHGIAVHNCSAPSRPENQLHAAIVEIIAHKDSHVKYSTVQNWYPGDENGLGGVYNFVTKRGECRGDNSHISWTQIETGSAITWKYPSVILRGDNSSGEFYSVALTNHYQQADTGTKMIHLGKNTKSTIIAKSISAGNSVGTYRGLVRIGKNAINSKNFTQCDSLIFGDARVDTQPYIESSQYKSNLEHEASTTKISEDNLFYLQQHGLNEEQAKNMLVNGFCKSVFQKLPAEFAVEAQKLLEINLEGSMG